MKVRFDKEQYDTMVKFEAQHHPDIWKWVMDKVGKSDGLDILDVSEEASIFSLSLAENHPTNKVTLAIRGDKPNFALPTNVSYKHIDFKKNTTALDDLGEYDLIILSEFTHEVTDMSGFFCALKTHLKDGAPIVIMTRPKNPPLPVPELVLILWKKLYPTREEVLAAANNAEMNSLCFSAAVPVTVDRKEWQDILFSGCFPPVRNTARIGERELEAFVKGKPPGKMNFEEKLTIFLLRNP